MVKLNILIGGKAGQGINKISEVVSRVLIKQGYYTFNYRDYPSLIRGGHNFNVLTISDEPVASNESKLDLILALDEKTTELHEQELKQGGIILNSEKFKELGRNLNIALAGALIKILGIEKEKLIEEIKNQFDEKAVADAGKGFESQEKKFNFEKLKNKISILSGSQAVAQGALNSKINLYLSYPMTPATGVLHELASKQKEDNLKVFQPENEIAVVNAGLGASFTGARTMVGTSGGGFDLMTEALSFQGQSEIPLTFYLASRPGPGTGVPTYTCQADLNMALYSGHGEFPRVVIAPGDIVEAIENTNEAMYLAEKFKTASIILSDKHLAESEFSFSNQIKEPIDIEITRNLPGKKIVRKSSYEHDEFGETTENAEITKKNADARIEKAQAIAKECEKFDMIKFYGNPESKNLVIGWGSTKGAILDAIKNLDVKFLQVIYLEPFSDIIGQEIKEADKIVLIENNSTAQLGRLIKEKTGVEIKERILRYDGRAFLSDVLRGEIKEVLK